MFYDVPDGKGIVYSLVGQAVPPNPKRRILNDIPFKTEWKEILEVRNWLRKPQRFKVKTEDISITNNMYKVTAKDYVDVMANSNRDFEWNIYVYKDCLLDFKVSYI